MSEGPLGQGRGRLLLIVGGVALVLLLVARGLVGLYVEVLWFNEVGYSSVFWKRTAWLWGGRILAGLAVTAVLFFNLRYAARTLGAIQIKRRFGNLEIAEQLPRSYVMWGMLGVSALLGLWFGGLVQPGLIEHVLLAAQGIEWQLTEPILGRDASFYVFLVPLLASAVTFALTVLFLLITVSVAGYAATGSVRWGPNGVVMQNQPRIHLGALTATFVLFLAARFWLARYLILQEGSSPVQGIVGFADAAARLPAFRILAILTVVAAGLIFFGSWRNRLVPVISGLGLVLVGGLVVTQLYPSLVQRFRVEPNELDRETPYIEHNLEFTRIGFGLDDMKRESFEYVDSGGIEAQEARDQLDDLPVWSEATLLATFRQLEARFPYYDFETVAIDRYPGPDGPVSVGLSVREVDPSGIQDPGWQNTHLRQLYIAGMGAVAVSASERNAEGRPPMFLASIPPEFYEANGAPADLRLRQPAVYFGSSRQEYAVITPTDSMFLNADGLPGVAGVDYPQGIQLSSFPRKLALAWHNRTSDLLFSGEVTDESHFVMRRQVRERVSRIAPFFLYPEDPYPVIYQGHIVWILEGLTATPFFPLSSRHLVDTRLDASYIRNSVKVVIDGVTGEVDFYAMPERDPLLEAYGSAFPDLLTPLDEMPRELRDHLRYPRSLLTVQANVLLQYHQNSAPVFHGQRDVWALPRELFRNTTPVEYRPEYGWYRLPGDAEERFYLTTVFVPDGRQNLTALLAGDLAADGSRQLRLLDILVEDPIPGPRQVEALVEQDPTISEQFSLWRTGGSQVWTGHLHLVPVGDRLVYMEPVFLAAESDAIPELRRFVVSDGRRVAFEPTLDEAMGVLFGDFGGAVQVGDIVAPVPSVSGDPSEWPQEALTALDEAEQRLRSGDWQGFGAALAELRSILEELARPPGG